MLHLVQLEKIPLPRGLKYTLALKKVLGRRYGLDLIFVPSRFMKNLNMIYRGKNNTTNILSFGLSDKSGQIFLDPHYIKKEANGLKESFRLRLWKLYLHGLLHLKGMDHLRSHDAKKMERAESKLLSIFNI